MTALAVWIVASLVFSALWAMAFGTWDGADGDEEERRAG